MSQNATIAETKARILDVAAEHVQIVTTGYQYDEKDEFLPFSEDQLFAVTTYYVGATQRVRQTLTLGGGGNRVTRVYDVVLYVVLLPEKATNRQEQAALEAAESYADLLPNHFAARPSLALEDDTGIVYAVGDMVEDGAKLFSMGGRWYGAIVHKLPVITFT